MTDSGLPAPPPRPRRPEPIAWNAVEPLAARAQAVAKGWLLALLERTPLDAIETIPAAALAAEGPALCGALARALGSDAELARLAPGGDLAPLAQRVPALAGARDAAAVVAAVEALRACTWAAAVEGAGAPLAPDELAALAERLAAAAATLAASAVGALGLAPASPAVPAASAPPAVPTASAPPAPAPSTDPAVAAEPPAVAAPALNGTASQPLAPVGDPREGPAGAMDDSELWIASLERHVDRCQREGGGLALLRVELVDGERLVASAPEAERGVPYGRLAQAIRRAIRRQDLVAADHQGRAWVIAPAVGRAGAIALAERIAVGVERGEHWRGAPLAATIGFAVYGEDGRDAATLIDRAEEAMLAASAAGLRIGEAIPQPHGAPDPDEPRPGPRLVS
jgi:hypothetical protein